MPEFRETSVTLRIRWCADNQLSPALWDFTELLDLDADESVTVVAVSEGDAAAPGAQPSRAAARPWTGEEDQKLICAYAAGQTIEALAQAHARSRFAIEARLTRFGKLPTPE